MHQNFQYLSVLMCLFYVALLFFGFIVTSAKGEVKLEVLKNENGIETLVQSVVKARSGTNFTLMCVLVVTETRTKLNEQFVWTKEKEMLNSQNTNDLTAKMENSAPGANLTFTNVTVKDRGVYYCASSKHKHVAVVHIIVNQAFTFADFKNKMYNLKYPVVRQKRSNENRDVKSNFLDEHSKTEWKSDDFYGKKTQGNSRYDQLDVRFLDNETNRNESSFQIQHAGTTDIFKIGLIASFTVLSLIACYQFIRCWRNRSCSLYKRYPASSQTVQAASTSQSYQDGSQMETELRTDLVQHSVADSIQNGNVKNLQEHLAQHRSSPERPDWALFSMDDDFKPETISASKNRDLPPTYEEVITNTVPNTSLINKNNNVSPSALPDCSA